MSTVFFAAGGTGGHIMPAISVARAVQKKTGRCTIVFVGVGREMERKLVGEAGFELETIPLAPFLGGGVVGKLRFLLSLPAALLAGRRLFAKHSPAFVFGFGGYPSFVPVFLAWCRGVPSALHEQNAEMGMANRVLARLAGRVFAPPGARGVPDSASLIQTPMPVRDAFYAIPRYALPQDPNAPLRVLILGGSQGARSVNDLIVSLSDVFQTHGAQVVHQTGAADAERIARSYAERGAQSVRVVPFITDMAAALSDAHLVISRAGAMAVAEISAAGRPAIYIPLSIAKAHQRANVQRLTDARAAFALEQDEHAGATLRAALEALFADRTVLAEMAATLRGLEPDDPRKPADVLAEEVLLSIARVKSGVV